MSELEKKILQEISERGLRPRPYLYFLAKRSMFWALALVSVILGGICVALMLFAQQDFMQTGGRGFSDMPFDEVFKNLPVVWFVSFVLFIISATYGLRNTKRGYRIRLWQAIVAAVVASGGLGSLLHASDLGRITNSYLAARLPAYASYTYVPYNEWSRPDEGYLGGEVLAVEDGRSLRLKDFSGREWAVDISTAAINTEDPISDEGDIAVRGERTGPSTFKAKSVGSFD